MDSVIIFCAKDLFILSVVLVAVGWFQLSRDKKINFAVQLILAGVVAYVLVKLAGKLYYDPRPFVSRNIQPLIAHAPDNGFPSDHAWFTATLAAVLWHYNKSLGYLAVAVALIVGSARVLADIHSPIDILGGFMIALVSAYFGFWIVERLKISDKLTK